MYRKTIVNIPRKGLRIFHILYTIMSIRTVISLLQSFLPWSIVTHLCIHLSIHSSTLFVILLFIQPASQPSNTSPPVIHLTPSQSSISPLRLLPSSSSTQQPSLATHHPSSIYHPVTLIQQRKHEKRKSIYIFPSSKTIFSFF